MWAVSGPLSAHSAPQSFVKFDFLEHSVRAEILIPESELAFAMPSDATSLPFDAYLLRHIAANTPAGASWKIEVRSVRKTVYLEHDYLQADVVMTPPAGSSARKLKFSDDAVTHEVRNHVIVVLARTANQPAVLGALQYPAKQLEIAQPAQ